MGGDALLVDVGTVQEYVDESLKAPVPPVTDTPAVARGNTLFHSSAAGCATCHSGDYLTDDRLHAGVLNPMTLHVDDVFPEANTPGLFGVFLRAAVLPRRARGDAGGHVDRTVCGEHGAHGSAGGGRGGGSGGVPGELVSERRLAAVLLLAAGVVVPRAARACGTSGPDGVSACSLAAYDEEQRPRWRVGMSSVYTSTVLSFSSTLHVGETRFAGLAQLSYAPTPRLAFSAGLGVAIGGEIVAPDGVHDFERGLVTDVSASYRLVDGATPLGHGFVAGSLLLSYTGSRTQLGRTGPETHYDALDLRAGLAAGLTWFRKLTAYGVVRAFGGPIYWTYEGTSELGTDTHHYQLGGGLAVLVVKRLDVFVEGVPLGEQAVAAGASASF